MDKMSLSIVLEILIFFMLLYLPGRIALGCGCLYDAEDSEVPENKRKCTLNPEIFDGQPFCNVNPDSLCPDVLRFTDCGSFLSPTKCTEISLSAEACKTSPNHFGFIRREEKACDNGAINELESFEVLNDSTISHLNARDECEEYCFSERNCWGCRFDCKNDCKWNAITDCTKLKLNELGKGGITQKPVCFDVKTINGETMGSQQESWNLGTCSKSKKDLSDKFREFFYHPYDITNQRCCLVPKIYDLTCHDYNDIPDGWNGGSLEILGHRYCDDFVGKTAKRKVKISMTTENPTSPELAAINYLEEVGRVCIRNGIQTFTKDEAKNACSAHENCVGYMNRIFDYFQMCDPISGYGCTGTIEEDKGEYSICFNNGKTSYFSIPDVEGNVNEQIKIYKKDDQDSTTKIELIPSAKLLLEHTPNTFKASDYSCPKGAKPFRLNPDTWIPKAPLFVTCHCEDHCSWYKCRLETPPSKCLEGTKGVWKWDKKSSYWVAQMDEEITDESGNKDNKSEISIPVVDANAYVDDTESNRSSVEYYEIATVVMLCLVFFLSIFAYFCRTPRKVFNNKELLSNKIKKLFTMSCACLATYMIMTQVVKYVENQDASSIHYKEFNKVKENKYPTFSICIKGEDFYYKSFKNPLFEKFGIDSLQYGNILKGQTSFVNMYNPEEKLYQKVTKDFKYVSSINFTKLDFKLSDVVAGLDFVAYNENDTTHYRDNSIENGLKQLPFKLTFQSWEEKCFTRISNDQKEARRNYDFISLKTETLKAKEFENTQFKLIVHYPGQLMRSMHKPALAANFHGLKGIQSAAATSGVSVEELKLRDIFIQQVEVLKMRKNSNQPCDDRILDDDAKFIDEVIKKSGCIPVYLKPLTRDDSKYKECQSQEQFQKVYHALNNYKDTLRSYERPCVDMRVLVREQLNEPLKNRHKEIDIKLTYNEGTYKEIINTRDFGMDAFWISIGGFVGLFLGYSISQIPDLLASIPDLFRNRDK